MACRSNTHRATRLKPLDHGQEQSTGGPKELGIGKEKGRRKRQERERGGTGKELGTLKAVWHWEDFGKGFRLGKAKVECTPG
jgi:hypothetical protein